MKTKKEQLNFKNVIMHLETKAETYDSLIKEMQSDFTTDKYDFKIKSYEKILTEFQLAIKFLKRLQKLKVIKKR